MFSGRITVDGVITSKPMGGEKQDLETVELSYMGGKFVFYADKALYALVPEVGTRCKISFECEADAKAPGQNKLKPKRGSCVLEAGRRAKAVE